MRRPSNPDPHSRLSWRGLRRRRERPRALEAGPAEPPVEATAPVAQPAEVPDLLDATARMTLDAERLRRTLAFAFEGGDVGDAPYHVLDEAALPASTWAPDCFAKDLFLEELVAGAFGVEIEGRLQRVDQGFLGRVMSHPPTDPRVVEFRRGVLLELEDPALRRAIEGLYLELVQLRALFVASSDELVYARSRRRLDTLACLSRVIERLCGLPETHSGLSRLGEFGRRVRGSEGYQALLQLLEVEDDYARVSFDVGVGADGRVRRMAVRRIEENVQNRFYLSPIERWVTQLLLFFRGIRVSGEELVERWLDATYGQVDGCLPALFQLLGHLEWYLAALGFADRCRARGLEVCLPEWADAGGREVVALFNPLLVGPAGAPVPTDLSAPSFETFTIVTGPNSGGKTRLMQAIGIAQMLAQSGVYVPARRARLTRATALFVSLNEAPAADQKEGRLGMELLRIRRLFERSPPGALVIFDELCSGTNPSEGEQIFVLVVALLRELGPEVFITTHFLEFAARLLERTPEGFAFRQVELDPDRRPTYRFVSGVATTSLAAETAARLGVTKEELIALVRRRRGPG